MENNMQYKIEDYPNSFSDFQRELKGKSNIIDKLIFLFILNGFFPLIIIYLLPDSNQPILDKEFLYPLILLNTIITFTSYFIMKYIEKIFFKAIKPENIIHHITRLSSSNTYANCKSLSEVISVRISQFSIIKSSIITQTNIFILIIAILFGLNYNSLKEEPFAILLILPAITNSIYLYLTRITDESKKTIFKKYSK